MDKVDFLRGVNLFSGLKDTYLKQIAEYSVSRSYKKGETIISQGDPGIGLFIISSGKVKIIKELLRGEKLEIATHGPGDFVGEMAVLDNAARTASVVALEDTECLVITAWDFKARMKAHPEIAFELLPVVVQRFRESSEMLFYLSRA